MQTVIGGDPDHDWGYTSEKGWGERSFAVPRGKVLGGSSAVNAGVWMRAPAVDFVRWAKAGLPHWSIKDVLPFFQSSERTVSGSDGWHGRSRTRADPSIGRRRNLGYAARFHCFGRDAVLY
ncbi:MULTISPECIES: GMC family oxidoreductase N-terminal domain-containing protein [Sinorhizobium]|uniref:GMC family oxidoreductase N-terminal domain-containing protein n=1 Tax=Rhizobium meliloti TaxID=382 RepID=UPI001300C4BB|nr:GMC family oxidoreductase N-terminal domain-containing protein [Sinorhizobium kummerowiae]